jgi:hypothetical protein
MTLLFADVCQQVAAGPAHAAGSEEPSLGEGLEERWRSRAADRSQFSTIPTRHRQGPERSVPER